MLKPILNTIVIIILILGLYLGGYCHGLSINIQTVAEQELGDIARLLSASAFTNRASMNLSAITNHYITHEKGQEGEGRTVKCEPCMQYMEYLVTNMPKLDKANEARFNSYYRVPFKIYQSQKTKRP